jgi:type VI protein secretion system component Hcp
MQIDSGSGLGPQIPIFQAKGGVEVSSSSTGGGGAGAGKATFSSFDVQKALDATSPDLIKFAATGKILKKATITINATQTSPAAMIELGDVVISSDSMVTSCDRMLESVKMDFGMIRITVGGATSCWDVIKNTTC